MDIELLYLYIGENITPVQNVEICFSNHYDIHYENQKLIIDKKNYEYDHFYGKHIKNCSLLVGKNGCGKTTILNILGLIAENSNALFNFPNTQPQANCLPYNKPKKLKVIRSNGFDCKQYGCWFALYHIDDEFYVEGYNFERLFGIKKLDAKESDPNFNLINCEFNLLIDYDFVEKKLTPKKFFQIRYDLPTHVYFYKLLSNKNHNNYSQKNNDYSIHFHREEIETVEINNIYPLFDKNKELFSDNFGQKATITLKIINQDGQYITFYNQVFEHLKLDLNTENDSSKNEFISYLYYQLGAGLWTAFLKQISIIDILPMIHNDFKSKNIKEIHRSLAIQYINIINEFNDENHQIINYVDYFDEFIKYLKDVDDKYFINGDTAQFSLRPYDINVQKLLNCYYKEYFSDNLHSCLKLNYQNLSSGEYEYIEVFGSILKMLSKIEEDTSLNSIILLIDEPDRTFHPEWTSNYISSITKILNDYGDKNNINFQLIITTHSPIMVSDMLPENIHKIEVLEDNKHLITKSSVGFASNYYDIIQDTFFLTNSIGTFSTKTIQMLQKQINQAVTIKELEQTKKYINVIGDLYLRNLLQVLYHNKKQELNQNKTIDDRITELQQEIDSLERQKDYAKN